MRLDGENLRTAELVSARAAEIPGAAMMNGQAVYDMTLGRCVSVAKSSTPVPQQNVLSSSAKVHAPHHPKSKIVVAGAPALQLRFTLEGEAGLSAMGSVMDVGKTAKRLRLTDDSEWVWRANGTKIDNDVARQAGLPPSTQANRERGTYLTSVFLGAPVWPKTWRATRQGLAGTIQEMVPGRTLVEAGTPSPATVDWDSLHALAIVHHVVRYADAKDGNIMVIPAAAPEDRGARFVGVDGELTFVPESTPLASESPLEALIEQGPAAFSPELTERLLSFDIDGWSRALLAEGLSFAEVEAASERLAELQEHGISALRLSAKAPAIPAAPAMVRPAPYQVSDLLPAATENRHWTSADVDRLITTARDVGLLRVDYNRLRCRWSDSYAAPEVGVRLAQFVHSEAKHLIVRDPGIMDTHGRRDLVDPEVIAPLVYRRASGGHLFGPTGPSWDDPLQEAIGNCFVVASLIARAEAEPEAICDQIQDLGDGTFAVRLMEHDSATDRFTPLLVEVDDDLLAGAVRAKDPAILWPGLLNKAFVLSAGTYALTAFGGRPEVALSALSGRIVTAHGLGGPDETFEILRDTRAKKLPIVAATRQPQFAPNDVGISLTWGHAYAVIGVEEIGGERRIRLRDTYGAILTLDPKTFAAAFSSVFF